MASSSIQELLRTIDGVRRRRLLILHCRQIGWSLAMVAALLMLCGLLAMVLPPYTLFSILPFVVWAAGLVMIIRWHVRAVRRFDVENRRLAQYIDERLPDLEQRLLTSMDVWDRGAWDRGARDRKEGLPQPPLVASLWRDTLAHVRDERLQRTTDARPGWLAGGAAFVLILVMAGMLWHWDRFAASARRVVWPFSMGAGDVASSADLEISPGDILIRRGSDVTIAARVRGNRSKDIFLNFRGENAQWQRQPMQTADASKQYYYLLSGVTHDMDYYVDSAYRRSKQFRIRVYDLTRVERIDADYHYPDYTGMENKTEKDNGDIAGPAGTQVRLQVTFDGPVQKALLRFDQGAAVDLGVTEHTASGSFVVIQDDTYVVDAVDMAGRRIENPIRYLVRAAPDTPPDIQVTMPGRDLQVMALEEVRIAVTAADDFGLTRMALTYSVGGAAEHRIDLLDNDGAAENTPRIEARPQIYLEDLKVAPGDIISYFVTAADNNGVAGPATAMSDIYFLEVINTDEAFRRASAMGGGGAGGMGQGGQGRSSSSSALVENQKNIIVATWKLLMRQRGVPGTTFDDDVKVVATSQHDLAQRTQMSLSRLNERFSFSDESYDRSVLHLREAVKQMLAAAASLSGRDLEAALGPEQAALQAVLKAESQSRQTAVQMARNAGGAAGNGESQRERQDLRELFDMEMGRLENRYEMPRTSADAGKAEADDLLRRLRELARRQERLNRAQLDAERRKDRMTDAQKRRRLEELRREQEALRRETEALSQRGSRQGRGLQTRSALNALNEAVDRMRQAAHNLGQGDTGSAAASGRQALQRLHDQEERIQRRSATVDDLLKAVGEKAGQLQIRESEIARRVEAARAAMDRKGRAVPGRSDPVPPNGIGEIIAQKDALKDTLRNTEELIRATEAKSKTSRPEIARQAGDVLRALASETLPHRVEESQADLKSGRLESAAEKEKAIEASIARIGHRLQVLDTLVPKSGEERLRAAADAADALARELDNLRRSVESLKMQQRRAALAGEQGAVQPGDGGPQGGDVNGLRDGLARSRRYAQGLLQPWAQGEGWAADARSIHRQLTRAQIEDFMNQPALWQKLMDPVREVASALRAQLGAGQPGHQAFSPSEQDPPSQYDSQVESYYRSLSELEEKGR